MRRAAKQLSVCAIALLLFYVLCRMSFLSSRTIYVPLPATGGNAPGQRDIQPETEGSDVIRIEEFSVTEDHMKLKLRPKRAGVSGVRLIDSAGKMISSLELHVGRLHTIYDSNTGGFTGDSIVMVLVTAFWILSGMVMIWNYRMARGAGYYAYSTIYYAGYALFAIFSGGFLMQLTVWHLLHPEQFNMLDGYNAIYSASRQFMVVTTPPVVLFALAMMISNIVLLFHEKFTYQNILGFLIGVLLLAGEGIGWWMFRQDPAGSDRLLRFVHTFENTYATIFAYFECILIGSVICGIHASRHKPVRDKDFIIILGCWFRKDGTLPPLLRGRVDKAVSFWQQQRQETGKEAILIPSGGQGEDESMPEAEAMRRYLITRNIPDERIMTEKKSRNTSQNFSYSGEIIHQVNPQGKVAFATSSYHVFRGGVWANMTGLQAEGIGSKTRWWFWPNAFMRETLGLLLRRWKQELAGLLVVIAFFDLLALALS